MLKTVDITLRITYDDAHSHSPEVWDFYDLLDMNRPGEEVELIDFFYQDDQNDQTKI